MDSRRDFLKGSIVLAGVVVAHSLPEAHAATAFPAGVVYTKDNPGRWAGKEGTHAPQVTVEGGKVTILTPHPMTPEHFIVKHTLIGADGKFLGEKTFSAADPKAESTYNLLADFKGAFWATSFCNKHDLWLTESAM